MTKSPGPAGSQPPSSGLRQVQGEPPVSPALQAPKGAKEDLPKSGGSWTRQKDGSLVRTGGTAPYDPVASNPAHAAPEAAVKPAKKD